MARTWQERGKKMALTWQERAVLSDLDTGGRRRKMVDTEERTVGAEEGRRAQETAKITPPKTQKNSHSKKEITVFSFLFPPL